MGNFTSVRPQSPSVSAVQMLSDSWLSASVHVSLSCPLLQLSPTLSLLPQKPMKDVGPEMLRPWPGQMRSVLTGSELGSWARQVPP
jgi:hypothetical protein